MKTPLLTVGLFLLATTYAHGQGAAMLVGGGTENFNDWSDAPYGWFVQQADSGKIINIDVSAASNWYPGYFIWLGADPASHEMQIADVATANDSATYKELVSASGIFIEGGDQWQYVSTWKGTLVEDALHAVFKNGGAIGGTSAGLAILGSVVFDARNGSALPEVVAYNPYHPTVQFTDDFLEILPDVFTDSHFHPRGRLGRLLPMLARRIQDFGDSDLMGIGVDDNSALCVAPDRIATAYGEGTVTLLFQSENSQIRVAANQAPTFSDINYYQLNHGAVFDVQNRSLVDAGPNMQPTSTPPPPAAYTAVVLDGSSSATAGQGEIVIGNVTGNSLNAWNGNLTQSPGNATVPHAVIIPKLWNDPDFFENRWVGGMYGIASNPHRAALYLDDNSSSAVSAAGVFTADRAAYILDSHGFSFTGFVQFRSTNYPGIVGAKLHFLGNGDRYDLSSHSFLGQQPGVTVTLTPHNPPITIPATGGAFTYDITISNISGNAITFDLWNLFEVPGRGTFGPTIGPLTLTFAPGQTFSRSGIVQNIPAGAPPGTYVYSFNSGTFPGSIVSGDSFAFSKTAGPVRHTVAAHVPEASLWSSSWDGQTHEVAATTGTPRAFALLQNYPNPFNPETTIAFSVGRAQHVSLEIFDIRGRLIATVADEFLAGGHYAVSWNGRDAAGREVASGVYHLQMRAGNFVQGKKLVLLR